MSSPLEKFHPFKLFVVLCVVGSLWVSIMNGFCLAGWLTLSELQLHDQVSLDLHVYWLYLHLPEYAAHVPQMRRAGYIGFGVSMGIWVCLMVGLFFLVRKVLRNERDIKETLALVAQRGLEWNWDYMPVPPMPDVLPPHLWEYEVARQVMVRTPRSDLKDDTGHKSNDAKGNDGMNIKNMAALALLGSALAMGKPHSVPEGDDLSNFNLHPTEIYEVILTVYNAPGPLWPDSGSMGYTVISKCVPFGVGPWGYGTSMPFDTRWPNRRATRIYKTYISRDLMLEKDYFGKGACEWTMDDVEFDITNQVNPDTFARFTSKMDEYDIYSGRIVKTYFLKDQYFHPESDVGPFAEEDYLRLSAVDQSKFFYTTLQARKVKPRPSLQRWILCHYLPIPALKRLFPKFSEKKGVSSCE